MNGSVLTVFVFLSSCPFPHLSIKRLVGSIEGPERFLFGLEVEVVEHVVRIARTVEDTVLVF